MNSIGFIGAGQMAQALAVGIANSHDQVEFWIADPNPDACQALLELVGNSRTRIAATNQQVLEESSIVFLAVKPQFVPKALDNIDAAKANQPLLVSVVAGTPIARLESLGGFQRVIRVMPNTPCLIGEGACAMTPSESVDDEEIQRTRAFLETVGMVVDVPEALLDSVTGLSGSGPAFVFSFIESLIEGGVLTGLPRGEAQKLAIQTVIGSALLAKQSGEHPAVLRDRVTSPGGTTIAGLKALEAKGFRDAVMSAVQAAQLRSAELGKL